MKASQEMNRYFEDIQKEVDIVYGIASDARSMCYDPEEIVDVRLAKNMAERVEGLMSTVAPGLAGTGFTKRIIELEDEYSPLDWRVALKIGEEVAKENFCKFKDKKEAMEVGIRAGFTYHTGGIVSAPLEGFVELRIKKNKKGEDYLAPTYAGPIRGAGGTASTFSLLLTDYIRVSMGLGKYDPSDAEINRYKTEISDYHERVTNLQYRPSDEEIDFLMRHLPIEIDGEPTEKFEVSNYKDIDRIETNRIRGGLCLVLAEGLSQKAPKLWKRLAEWGEEFKLDWGFIEEFLKLQKKIKAKNQKGGGKQKLSPNYTFIADLVAGRPVLTHPMANGGFRMRYGRSRTSGFSSACIHPATMVLLDGFIATGTQLKMERPGKAASITPCDSIDGPIVRLVDGNVLRVSDVGTAKKIRIQVESILFLGDILFNYGDFSENGHILVPVGYNQDWWKRELEKALAEKGADLDIAEKDEVIARPNHKISAKSAFDLCDRLGIPVHPDYTYHWNLIDTESLIQIFDWFRKGKRFEEEGTLKKIVLPLTDVKKHLEDIGMPHQVASNEFIILDGEHGFAMSKLMSDFDPAKSVMENINSRYVVRDKSGTFVGARMGRPEKAKMRKLSGSPQVLFPIGEEGGRLRSFQAALEEGKVTSDFPMYRCECGAETIYKVCDRCGKRTERLYHCSICGLSTDPKCDHGDKDNYRRQEIDIKRYFQSSLEILKERVYPDLIKGVRGTMNKDHTPEYLLKGILRAKHEVFVNKDGTVRFDMSELPITHFKPKEIRTSISKLRKLGYTHDYLGKPLEHKEQIVEIKPQDVILPAGTEAMDEQSDKVLIKVTRFVDELLVKLYKKDPYYNASTTEDLAGHLVIGLAPHISAGTVGRIIGFSNTQGMLAHPLFHAAMRRDCDGDEACVIMLMDAFLNFSRQYLPDSRGAKTMDAPLVLTSKLNPAEVDDMAHGLDIVTQYPLELYDAAAELKNPWEVKIRQIKDELGNEGQYENMGFTHDTSDFNIGINCSSYKALPSMEEKLKGQMRLAEKIRAVNESDVARLVIEKHLLRDTKGNLRKFSTQQFRCVKCNDKYRRPPLAGKCKCGGRLIFTVSQGSVTKYLQPTISLAQKYNVPSYLQQSIEFLQLRIDTVFGREREKQEGLGKWFG